MIKYQKIKNKGIFITNKPTRFPDKPSLLFFPTDKIVFILMAQAAQSQFGDFAQQMSDATKSSRRR